MILSPNYNGGPADWRDVMIVGFLRDIDPPTGDPIESVVNFPLQDFDEEYTIPDGKVLVIEHVFQDLEQDSDDDETRILYVPEMTQLGYFMKETLDTGEDLHYGYPRPVRIVGGPGASVGILTQPGVDWKDLWVFGYLRDM